MSNFMEGIPFWGWFVGGYLLIILLAGYLASVIGSNAREISQAARSIKASIDSFHLGAKSLIPEYDAAAPAGWAKEGHKQWVEQRGHREPTIDELLNEHITSLLMARDGVQVGDVVELVENAKAALDQ